MNITIRSISEEHVHCPRCGSKNIVARNTENTHCGNCGTYFIVEYVEMLKMEETVFKEQNEYTQLSLFDEGQNVTNYKERRIRNQDFHKTIQRML